MFGVITSGAHRNRILSGLLAGLSVVHRDVKSSHICSIVRSMLGSMDLRTVVSSMFSNGGSSLSLFLGRGGRRLRSRFGGHVRRRRGTVTRDRISCGSTHVLGRSSSRGQLRPVCVRLFFRQTFHCLNNRCSTIRGKVCGVASVPSVLDGRLGRDCGVLTSGLDRLLFYFSGRVFLSCRGATTVLNGIRCVGPKGTLFSTLMSYMHGRFGRRVLGNAVLMSPRSARRCFTFFIGGRVASGHPGGKSSDVTGRLLDFVCRAASNSCRDASPTGFLSLRTPSRFTGRVLPPRAIRDRRIVD